MDDHTDASRKLRNCSPRLSEPPTPAPDCSPRLSETPTKDDEEIIERCKLEAKRAYDTLIQMGGRPTRPIRPTPPWKKVLVGGELCYRYAEQVETLFYDCSKPGSNTSLTEADFITGYWVKEKFDSWKNYDGGRIFLILSNGNVSIIQNLQERRTWNGGDTRTIHSSQQA